MATHTRAEVLAAVKTTATRCSWLTRQINRRRAERGVESPIVQIQLDALRVLIHYASEQLARETEE